MSTSVAGRVGGALYPTVLEDVTASVAGLVGAGALLWWAYFAAATLDLGQPPLRWRNKQ